MTSTTTGGEEGYQKLTKVDTFFGRGEVVASKVDVNHRKQGFKGETVYILFEESKFQTS